MITNDKELQVVLNQLHLAESALDSIRREVKPKSEAKYELIAEAYVDQIAELKAEIDSYREAALERNGATCRDPHAPASKISA